MMLLAISTTAIFESACRSAGGCPPLVTYPIEMQRRAASELRALPKDSALSELIVDYGKLRKACRV
jgi:hypothetical protein